MTDAGGVPTTVVGAGIGRNLQPDVPRTGCDSGKRPPVRTPVGSDRDGLRIHAEADPRGVRIWLGTDAQAGSHVAALACELIRQIHAQGRAVAQVTWNGRALYSGTQAASPQSPPESS